MFTPLERSRAHPDQRALRVSFISPLFALLALLLLPSITLHAQEDLLPTPLEQAVSLYDAGEFTQASLVFREEATRERDPLAYLWWGLSLYRSGTMVPSLEAWNLVLTSATWRPTAELFIALTHWEGGRVSEAREWFARCAATRSNVQGTCEGALALLERRGQSPEVDSWDEVSGIREAVEMRTSRVDPSVSTNDPEAQLREPTLMAQAPVNGTTTTNGAASTTSTTPYPTSTNEGNTASPPSANNSPELSFAPGTFVQFRAVGSSWQPGVVIEQGEDGTESAGEYLIRDSQGHTAWYDASAVASRTRTAEWTEWFTGSWEVMTPSLSLEVASSEGASRTGAALPPIRIYEDGTYLWGEANPTSNGSRRGEDVPIRGRWQERSGVPGITLLNGLYGADWTLSNASTPENLARYGREVMMLTSRTRPTLIAVRLPA